MIKMNQGYPVHGKAHTKVWNAWRAMKNRCYREKDQRYHLYGAKGKVVCSGLMMFNDFFKILGEPPTSEHSLDRPKNEGNYSCGACQECIEKGWNKNVRWATDLEQAQNTSSNHKIPFNGEMLCIIEVARRVNIPYKTLHARIKYRGWDVETAIKAPVGKPHSYKKLKHDKNTAATIL